MLFFILMRGVNSRLTIVFLPAFPLVLCIIFSNIPYLYKMKGSQNCTCAQLCFQGESVTSSLRMLLDCKVPKTSLSFSRRDFSCN